MANRQYIGARYVPKVFNNNGSNEWVSGITYEPLTIVTYLNNSYTSVKPVPSNVGSPNLATEYWACTGDFTGEIDDLRELISDTASTLNTKIDTQDNALQGQINTINGKLTSIDKLNRSVNRKFIFIGDSYNDADKMHCADDLIYLLGLTLNTNAFVSSQGGAGFVRYNDATGNGFLALLQALDNSISDKNSITDIIVLGGANDILAVAQTENIQANMQDFMDYAKLHYPNAKVGVGFIGRFKGEDGTRTWAKYADALYAYRQKAGASGNYYIECSDTASHGVATNMTDHVHPNAAAGALLTRCIASQLIGNTASFSIHDYGTLDNGFSYDMTILNNNAHFVVNGLPTITTPVILSGYGKHGTPTEIGEWNNFYFNKPLFIRCQVQANGDFYVGWLRFLYNKIALNIENNAHGPLSVNTIIISTSNEALSADFDSMILC